VAPAIRQNIPIVVRNSRHPEMEGTCIGPGAVSKPGTVKAITCRTGMTVVHLLVPGTGMLSVISDGLNDLFERNQVRVEMVQAQQDGVSFAVESSPRLPELLRGVDGSVRIVVEEDSAIVSLTGDGITTEPIEKRALSALLKDSGVRMVSQGGSRKSFSFAVPESKLAICVENLHREFFRAADPEIFAPTPESGPRLFVAKTAEDRFIRPNLGLGAASLDMP
jgi:aspartate kinase